MRVSWPARSACSVALRSRGDAWLGRDASTISTPAAGGPVQQAGREVDGRGVGPVEVVEDEHQRLGGRQPFEQLADRPVGPVALVQGSGRPAAAEVRQRREDLRELDAHVFVEVRQAPAARRRPGTRPARRRRPRTAGRARGRRPLRPGRCARGRRRGRRARPAAASCRCRRLRRSRSPGRGGRRARRAPRRAARARGGVLRSGRRARTWMPRARAYVRVGARPRAPARRSRPRYGSRPDVGSGLGDEAAAMSLLDRLLVAVVLVSALWWACSRHRRPAALQRLSAVAPVLAAATVIFDDGPRWQLVPWQALAVGVGARRRAAPLAPGPFAPGGAGRRPWRARQSAWSSARWRCRRRSCRSCPRPRVRIESPARSSAGPTPRERRR